MLSVAYRWTRDEPGITVGGFESLEEKLDGATGGGFFGQRELKLRFRRRRRRVWSVRLMVFRV